MAWNDRAKSIAKDPYHPKFMAVHKQEQVATQVQERAAVVAKQVRREK